MRNVSRVNFLIILAIIAVVLLLGFVSPANRLFCSVEDDVIYEDVFYFLSTSLSDLICYWAAIGLN